MVGRVFLSSIALLCSSAIAELNNYTIDDASPSVVYSEHPILQCNPSNCPSSWTNQVFNETSTITQSPIIVSFTGSAVYVFLAATGGCIFNIDGADVALYNNGVADGYIGLAYHNTSIPAGSHRLLISPAQPESVLEFDYIIYTVDVPKSRKVHVGAIVGGMIGGVVFIAVLVVGAFFLRKRDQRHKLRVRGVPLGDGEDKSSIIKMMQMPAEKS